MIIAKQILSALAMYLNLANQNRHRDHAWGTTLPIAEPKDGFDWLGWGCMNYIRLSA